MHTKGVSEDDLAQYVLFHIENFATLFIVTLGLHECDRLLYDGDIALDCFESGLFWCLSDLESS